jgi:replication-associated recombination protein RarA
VIAEVTSSFQKCVRRGDEDGALFWGTELCMSGYSEYAWKRMKIMVSEDVGLAEPTLPATISALYQNWKEQAKKKDAKHEPERLFIVHAILLLVRARKSRMVDSALITYFEGGRPRRDVPEFALDRHTTAGRKMGRGWAHFFDEGAKLANIGLDDPYEQTARSLRSDDADASEPLFGDLE